RVAAHPGVSVALASPMKIPPRRGSARRTSGELPSGRRAGAGWEKPAKKAIASRIALRSSWRSLGRPGMLNTATSRVQHPKGFEALAQHGVPRRRGLELVAEQVPSNSLLSKESLVLADL